MAEVQKAFKPYNGWAEEDLATWKTLGECVNGGGEVFFLVPGLARAHATVRGPTFNTWFSQAIQM